MKWTLFDIGDKHARHRKEPDPPPEPDDSLETFLNLLGRVLIGVVVGSVFLGLFGEELLVMSWIIHNWGEGVAANILLIALIVGIVLVRSFNATFKEPPEYESDPEDSSDT